MPDSAPSDVSLSERVSRRTPEARQYWPFGLSHSEQSRQGPKFPLGPTSVCSIQHFRTCGSHLGFPKAPLSCVHLPQPTWNNIYFHTRKYCSDAVIQLSVCPLFFNVFISLLPRRRYLKKYTYCTPQHSRTHSGYRKYSLVGYLNIRLSGVRITLKQEL